MVPSDLASLTKQELFATFWLGPDSLPVILKTKFFDKKNIKAS